MTIALSDRAHLYVRPAERERLERCFATVFESAPVAAPSGSSSDPILVFRFPGGGSISVEFTADALEESQARRGAWLEVRTDDVAALERRIAEAGLRTLRHPATRRLYFVIPGGQVFGIASRT